MPLQPPKRLVQSIGCHARHRGPAAWALRSIAGLALLAHSHGTWAGALELPPGRYDGGLTLAVAPQDQGRITAHLASPAPGCRIVLHGVPQGERVPLAMATPGREGFIAYGELRVSGDDQGKRVHLDLPVPPGCAGAAQAWRGKPLRLIEAQPLVAVRWVSAPRAHFHDQPHESTRRKGFVVAWDAVAVTQESPAFAQAEYLGGARPVTGWLRQEDLFAADHDPRMTYVRTQLPPMQGKWPVTPLPVDVRAYLVVREQCEHFEGEEGTDPQRARYLEQRLAQVCGDARARHQALLAAHAGQAAAQAFLRANGVSP